MANGRPTGQQIERKLLPNGEPDRSNRSEFFELYRLMVASAESLVNRRQAVNTFFLTLNGALVTVVGLFLRGDGNPRLKAWAILLAALAGVIVTYAWSSILKTFGQLNTGKFEIINRMERRLAAAIYDAEWEALGRGEDHRIYKTFTSREAMVPKVALAIYGMTALLSVLVGLGRLTP